jgi:ribosomal protein L11 methylase PrmA
VFTRDGVLYRRVNESYADEYDRLVESGLARALIDRGYLIPHEEVDIAGIEPRAHRILRPELIPFVSYPYEWCFSQLRDAALLTLRIQLLALDHGMTLKDASAYNVQFRGCKPVFIDTLSFERYREGQPWVAYRQFCQHFLAPLALIAHRDARLNQLFRVFMDGVPLDLAASLLPRSTRLRPSLAMHIHLHARAQRNYSASDTVMSAAKARTATVSARSLRALIENLQSAISGLTWKSGATEWGDYYDHTNYSEGARDEKERLVADALEAVAPRIVWDLGANTGRFSRLASSRQVPTVAFDIDTAAVEKNYQEAAAAGDRYLLPLLLDLTNPSPALGWASEERSSLEQRGPADVVLALALMHHLAIGNNVPLSHVAEFLSRLCRHLVIEFVPKSDSQVQRLLSSRADVFPSYTQEGFESAIAPYFAMHGRQPIAGSERTLYLLRTH